MFAEDKLLEIISTSENSLRLVSWRLTSSSFLIFRPVYKFVAIAFLSFSALHLEMPWVLVSRQCSIDFSTHPMWPLAVRPLGSLVLLSPSIATKWQLVKGGNIYNHRFFQYFKYRPDIIIIYILILFLGTHISAELIMYTNFTNIWAKIRFEMIWKLTQYVEIIRNNVCAGPFNFEVTAIKIMWLSIT